LTWRGRGLWVFGLFGRLLLVDVLLAVAWLAAFGLILVLVLGIPASAGAPDLSGWLGLFLRLSGLLTLLGLVASVVHVAVAYAQRAIVFDGAHPVQGLTAGLRLIRRNLVTTVLVWLIGVVISIAGIVALVLALLVLLIPAGLVALLGVALDAVGVRAMSACSSTSWTASQSSWSSWPASARSTPTSGTTGPLPICASRARFPARL
jgi:hypothetical protein